jgi:hypothetical protein
MPKTRFHYKGTEFNSKGEYEIAQFLKEMNIEFEFEFPIAVMDDGKVKVWYPDFYLKEYQIVIEYFGMYEHNQGYRDATEHKKEIYKSCGVQFLPIYQLKGRWQEYTLTTILSHLEYKHEKMQKNVEKLKKGNSKFKSLLERLLGKKKEEENKKELKSYHKTPKKTTHPKKQVTKKVQNKSSK